MAEAVRFELTEPCGSSVFKTDGLNHSPTLPKLGGGVDLTTSKDKSFDLSPPMVPKERIELPTYRLQGGCTTAVLLGLIGSVGWIRTSDQLINSQLRYHCATTEYILLIVT